ncbi:dihydrofolate reductase family protein [Leptospira jelokensis]|uniref:dihydrofolate reductase family protein n=1 Tax=Leptospira jelokensis TaxID=2484931 RepID=UPI00109114AC|nr:dihydrofolate reductase family protein [Leptospira jelokensis]TGM06165.1 dihydrofolate reductase [Leptospira jelokensis]
MREIHYYVATSINGYIDSHSTNTSLFLSEGDHATEYKNDLLQYSDVLMGKKTYEYGFNFGLTPGEKAYPWMDHYLVSDHLAKNHFGENINILRTTEIKSTLQLLREEKNKGNIYLCGGGKLAGLLWEHHEIDRLFVKVNPMVIAKGVPLFDSIQSDQQLKFVRSKEYKSKVVLLEYKKK